MDAERWRRLSPLLDALLEHEPALRSERLEAMRKEDPALARELEELLRMEDESGDFLADPLLDLPTGPTTGSVIGPYRLERMLGEGGMGQVWLAQRDDGLYRRRVALKLLRPGLADPNLRLRFTRERQILARLEHPHIARLLDAGISGDGQPYLALEYVDGEPITDWCKSQSVPLDARLRLFQQVCRALSHAHANLIVHRDLKPSNILVTPLGEVQLLDFGIAKLLDAPDAGIEHTRTGSRAFTLHYAAPEQLRGEPVTTMTDVYSLGMVLIELLADARPYRLKRQSDAAWEDAILHTEPQRASQLLQRASEEEPDRERAIALRRRARMVAGDLDNIARKALSKPPEQRYPSVEALAKDIERYREGKPVHARAQKVGYRLSKFVFRHRWALATSSLIALVLAGALGIVTWQARSAVEQAARARAMQDFVLGLIEQAGNASPNGQVDLPRLLDTGQARIDRELAQQPASRAELYGVIAALRTGIGEYQRAAELLQRQRALIAGLDNPPQALVLESASRQGHLERLRGNAQACIEAMQPMEQEARRREGTLPAEAAEFASQLGRCRRATGQFEAARTLFKRALALRQGQRDEIAIAESLADLASVRAATGDVNAALPEYEQALARLERNAGGANVLAIDLQRQLCALERNLGRLDRAAPYCERAYALGMQLRGRYHPAVIDARRQLAAVHVDQGRFSEAKAEFTDTRRILLARLGPHHTEIARDENSLAIAAWELGDLRAALSAIDHGIAILRATPQPNNLDSHLFNKAMILHEVGDDSQALALLREARRLRLAKFGPAHGVIGDTDRLIGNVQAALGQPRAAAASLQSAADLTRKAYGAQHLHTLRAALSLARFHGRERAAPGQSPGLAEIAATPGHDMERAKLRWLARGYLAERQCRSDSAQGRHALDRLLKDMRARLPEGGVIVREVGRIRSACKQVTAATSPSVARNQP